jgi:hypothetical protein
VPPPRSRRLCAQLGQPGTCPCRGVGISEDKGAALELDERIPAFGRRVGRVQRAPGGRHTRCGGPLTRPRHVRCEACWAKTPAQSREVRRRRGRAIAAAVAGVHDWRSEHPGEARPPAEAFAPIRDRLASVKLTAIMVATGLAKSTASQVRSGRAVPHVRHWQALEELASAEAASRDTRV